MKHGSWRSPAVAPFKTECFYWYSPGENECQHQQNRDSFEKLFLQAEAHLLWYLVAGNNSLWCWSILGLYWICQSEKSLSVLQNDLKYAWLKAQEIVVYIVHLIGKRHNGFNKVKNESWNASPYFIISCYWSQ